jgi:hypothetical protein
MPACDPVGLSEIAQELRVKQATAQMWHHRGLMPEAKWTVSGRPAWNWPDIEKWAVRTERLKPRKKTSRRQK